MFARIFALIPSLVLVLLLACGGGNDDETTTPPSAEVCDPGSSDPSDAYDLLRPSVVYIAVETAEGVGAGTGFVYSEGEVVTNAHVVADADVISVEFAGGDVARVSPDDVRIDGDRDIAFIEVDTEDAPSAITDDPSSLRRGQRLIAIGYPILADEAIPEAGSAGDPSITDGVFSAPKPLLGLDWLVISVPINPGNSGGPIADLCGTVYGIGTAHYPDAENASLAIPSDDADDFVAEVRAGGGDPLVSQSEILGESGLPVSIEEALREANLSAQDLPPGFGLAFEDFTTGEDLGGGALRSCEEPIGIQSRFVNDSFSADITQPMLAVESYVFAFPDAAVAEDCFATAGEVIATREFVEIFLDGVEADTGVIIQVDGVENLAPPGLFEQERGVSVTGSSTIEGTTLPFQAFGLAFRDGSQVGVVSPVFLGGEGDLDVTSDLSLALASNMQEVFGEGPTSRMNGDAFGHRVSPYAPPADQPARQ